MVHKKRMPQCSDLFFVFFKLVYAICDSSCGLQGLFLKGSFCLRAAVLDAPNIKRNFEDNTGFLKSSTSYEHTPSLTMLVSAAGIMRVFSYK